MQVKKEKVRMGRADKEGQKIKRTKKWHYYL